MLKNLSTLIILIMSKILNTDADKPDREEYYNICWNSTIHKFLRNISPNRNKNQCSCNYYTYNSKPCKEIF